MAVQPNIGDVKLTDAAISAQQTIVPRQPTSYDPISEQIGEAADFFRQKQVQEVVTYATEKGKAEGAKLAAEQRRVADGAAFPREEAGKFVGYDRVLSKEQSAPISDETYGFNPLSSGYQSFQSAYREASAVNIAVQAKAEMDRISARVMVDQRVDGTQKLAILRDYGTKLRDQYSKSLEGIDPNLQNAINASLNDQLVSSFVQASDDIAKADIERVRGETLNSVYEMRNRLADDIANPKVTRQAFMENMFLLAKTLNAAVETGAMDRDTGVKLYSGPGNLMDTLAQNYVDAQAIRLIANGDIAGYNALADEVNSGGFINELDARFKKGKIGFKWNITMKRLDAEDFFGGKEQSTTLPTDIVTNIVKNGGSLFDPVDLDAVLKKAAISDNKGEAILIHAAKENAARNGRYEVAGIDVLEAFKRPDVNAIFGNGTRNGQTPIVVAVDELRGSKDAGVPLYLNAYKLNKNVISLLGTDSPLKAGFADALVPYERASSLKLSVSTSTFASPYLPNGKPNVVTNTAGTAVNVANSLTALVEGYGDIETVGRQIYEQHEVGAINAGLHDEQYAPMPSLGDTVVFADDVERRANADKQNYGTVWWEATGKYLAATESAGGAAHFAPTIIDANMASLDVDSKSASTFIAFATLQSAIYSASSDDPTPNKWFKNALNPTLTVKTLLERYSRARSASVPTDEKSAYAKAKAAATEAIGKYIRQTNTALGDDAIAKVIDIVTLGMLTISEDGKDVEFSATDENNSSILENLGGGGKIFKEERWGGKRTLVAGKADYLGPPQYYNVAQKNVSEYLAKNPTFKLRAGETVTVVTDGKSIKIGAMLNGRFTPLFGNANVSKVETPEE